jgi:hypothetical protein
VTREELIEAASREAASVILFSDITDKEGIRAASDAIAQRIVALVEPAVQLQMIELGWRDPSFIARERRHLTEEMVQAIEKRHVESTRLGADERYREGYAAALRVVDWDVRQIGGVE